MAPKAVPAPSPLTQHRRVADFANHPHDDYGPRLNAATWLLTIFAAVFLGLRLYCKRIRRKKLWWDDYVLIASFVALLAQTSLLSVNITLGFGKHTWDIKDWYNYLMIANVTGVCSITAAAWSKTSFAITLLRFTDGWMRRLVWFVIITVNLFLGLSGIFTYIQCWPISHFWDVTVKGTCWPGYIIVRYNSFSSAWSGVMDIVLATVPWWIINRRALNRKERLGVLVAMSMGIFAGIASIAKTTTLWAISDPDTIHSVSLMIMATAEISITIVAASIPVLRALVKNTMLAESQPRLHYYQSRSSKITTSQVHSTREVISPQPQYETSDRKEESFIPDFKFPESTARGPWISRADDSWLSSTSTGLVLDSREQDRVHPPPTPYKYHSRKYGM